MILHENFVMLHLPKTGSTFARKVIKTAIENKNKQQSFFTKILQKLGLQKSTTYKEHFVAPFAGTRKKSEHGAYVQIPQEYKDKPIVSILRDPYGAFLSRFEFRQRSKDLHFVTEEHLERFPNFPNLNIDEYIEMNQWEIQKNYTERGLIPEGLEVGGLSLQFIRLFFKNPEKVLKNLTQDYLENGDYQQDMAPITFLHQNKLNQDLYQFLLNNGFTEKELEFMKNQPKENVTKSKGVERDKVWTQNALDYIEQNEKLYLRISKDLGLEYQPPKLTAET